MNSLATRKATKRDGSSPAAKHHAEGNLAKLIFVVVVSVAVVGVGTVLTPWSAEYEVKTGARMACGELIKITRAGHTDPSWEPAFVRKATSAGVHLKKGQYLFDIKEVKNEGVWRCHFKAAWRSKTPWLFLTDVFPDVPPLEYVNRIDKTYDIMNSY